MNIMCKKCLKKEERLMCSMYISSSPFIRIKKGSIYASQIDKESVQVKVRISLKN